jgi:hypothetical protein
MNALNVSVSAGKVTIENSVCRWGLLELPRRPTKRERDNGEGRATAWGEGFLARAVCESKDGKWPAREVKLSIDPATALAVEIALAGGA